MSTHVLKDQTIADALQFIAHTGFKAAEVWTSDLSRTGEAPAAIGRAAYERQLRLSVHGPALVIDAATATITEKSLTRIIRAIEVASLVDSATVVIHPPRRWPTGYHPDRYWHQLEDALNRLSRRAQAAGIVLALEGMDGDKPEEVVTKPADIRRVMAFGLPNLRICLDMAHIQACMHPADFLDQIDPAWVHHVHLSDRSKKRHHLPLGQGTMPIAEIIGKLHQCHAQLVIIEGRIKGRGKSVVVSNYRYLKDCNALEEGVEIEGMQ